MTTTPALLTLSDRQIMFTALCRIALGESDPQTIADDAIAASRKAALSAQPAAGGDALAMLEIVMGSRQQCDEDGQLIAVSRQALDELAAMLATHPQAAPPNDADDDEPEPPTALEIEYARGFGDGVTHAEALGAISTQDSTP